MVKERQHVKGEEKRTKREVKAIVERFERKPKEIMGDKNLSVSKEKEAEREIKTSRKEMNLENK